MQGIRLIKYFLLLNFMFLFGFSHASATSVDMNALDTNCMQTYAGELNFCHIRNDETVSKSSPLNNQSENTEHHLLFIESEEDEVQSSHDKLLKFKEHFIILYKLNYKFKEGNLVNQFYFVSEEATLPTDHFLYLELQVFRI